MSRDTNYYATGFRPVDSGLGRQVRATSPTTPRGAVAWLHPTTGETFYGAYNRPGVDDTSVRWPFMPSQNYRSAAVAAYDIGGANAPDIVGLTTGDNREEFDHQQGSLVVDWDIRDNLSLKVSRLVQQLCLLVQTGTTASRTATSPTSTTRSSSRSRAIRMNSGCSGNWATGSRRPPGCTSFGRRATSGTEFANAGVSSVRATRRDTGRKDSREWVLRGTEVVGWVMPECIGIGVGGSQAGGDLNVNDATRGYGKYCGDPGKPYSQSVKTGDTDGPLRTPQQGRQREPRLLHAGRPAADGHPERDARRPVLEGLARRARARGGYSEIEVYNKPWLPWALSTACALNPDSAAL